MKAARRRPRILPLLLALALGLAACGTTATPAPTAPPAGGGAPTAPAVTPTAALAAPATLGPDAAPYLVTAATLQGLLGDPHVRVVDMGSTQEYEAGHIPGAIHIDWSELQVTDTRQPSIAAWQGTVGTLLGSRGIAAGDRVVIYDHGTLYGARLWWVLDQLGHAAKQILDGGFAAWQAAGGAVSTAAPTAPATTYTPHPQPAVLATESQVLEVLGKPDVNIVDARSPDEYNGKNTDGTPRGGHIPGAVNVPYAETVVSGTPAYFKPPADLRALFAAQGVMPGRQVITYCSTGVRASVDYFALRLAGFAQVRVYTGSWQEWGADPTAPLEK